MFNLSGSEMIFILLAALVLLGPEKLPEALRKVGRVYAEVRKITTGFQSELRNAIDEPTKDLRDAFEQPAKEFRNTAEQAKSAFSLQELNRPSQTAPTRRVADQASSAAAEPVSDAFGTLPASAGEPDAVASSTDPDVATASDEATASAAAESDAVASSTDPDEATA